MKLIIDIPDEDYQRLNSREKIITLSCNIVDVVKNGTPLDDVLGKIRAEIIQMPTISLNANDIYKADVLAIIDK